MIEALLEQGLYKEALENLSYPETEQEYYYRVVCLYGLQEYKQALQEVMTLKLNAKDMYYDIVSMQVSILKELEEYDQAINILVEELSMPYIPYQYEMMFNEAYDAILLDKQDSLYLENKKAELFDEEALALILEKPNNEDLLYMAIDQLRSMNVRRFMPSIRQFLVNRDAPSLAKSFVLEVLIEQEVDDDLEVEKYGIYYDVNPSLMTFMTNSEAYEEISEKLAFHLEDENPSLLLTCDEFLQFYLYDYFPREFFEEDYGMIAGAIHYYVATLQSIEVDKEDIEYMYNINMQEIEAMISIFERTNY